MKFLALALIASVGVLATELAVTIPDSTDDRTATAPIFARGTAAVLAGGTVFLDNSVQVYPLNPDDVVSVVHSDNDIHYYAADNATWPPATTSTTPVLFVRDGDKVILTLGSFAFVADGAEVVYPFSGDGGVSAGVDSVFGSAACTGNNCHQCSPGCKWNKNKNSCQCQHDCKEGCYFSGSKCVCSSNTCSNCKNWEICVKGKCQSSCKGPKCKVVDGYCKCDTVHSCPSGCRWDKDHCECTNQNKCQYCKWPCQCKSGFCSCPPPKPTCPSWCSVDSYGSCQCPHKCSNCPSSCVCDTYSGTCSCPTQPNPTCSYCPDPCYCVVEQPYGSYSGSASCRCPPPPPCPIVCVPTPPTCVQKCTTPPPSCSTSCYPAPVCTQVCTPNAPVCGPRCPEYTCPVGCYKDNVSGSETCSCGDTTVEPPTCDYECGSDGGGDYGGYAVGAAAEGGD